MPYKHLPLRSWRTIERMFVRVYGRRVQILEAPALPWPIQPSAPRCAVLANEDMTTGPSLCTERPTSFALVRFPSGSQPTWCIFLCTRHAILVPPAEPLDKVASAELADRIVEYSRAIAGETYRAPTPLQLSTP